jgi:ribonucleoside-diphosphate reductase alpha subunit
MTYVVKRNGNTEDISFDKILRRLNSLSDNLDIDTALISQKVISGIYPGISTHELDILASEVSVALSTSHPDYNILSGRILISNHQKQTKDNFLEVSTILYNSNPKVLSDDYFILVKKYSSELEKHIDYKRDFLINFFGFKTLEKGYILKSGRKVVERPQHMWMRVALAIFKDDINNVLKAYTYLSNLYYTHATPTLFHAGTISGQYLSCFLLGCSDSVEGIYEHAKNIALISKGAGGIGGHYSNIRGKNSIIKGTNGFSNGLIPMFKVFNDTMKFINQGGKRQGSCAVYIEPHHPDTLAMMDLRKNTGHEEDRARDLFTALWVSDLFMERVKNNEIWSFFSEDECPGLSDCYGDDYKKLYLEYESQNKYRKQMSAQEVWQAIYRSQVETGTPYICFKDSCNSKSNQQNLGVIKSSNLCSEIIEYSDDKEYACCTLASISLSKFINDNGYDFEKLKDVTKLITKALDIIIDINNYPVEETKRSNLRHRPLGIGVQGLADTFIKLKYPFESDSAKKLNIQIFESMYYGALESSSEIAEMNGPYSSYEGSPMSKNILQFDMWDREPTNLWDWNILRDKIKSHGVRNSLLLAVMPTASTSNILGNTECIEPVTTNVYVRRTLAGEFIVINSYLMNDLIKLNLWNSEMKDKIMVNDGSIQNIEEIPDNIKQLYKTAWEIKNKSLIDMAADRGAYVCQSQSLNLFYENSSYNQISSSLFYAWKKGLKTGVYYTRIQPKLRAQQFTIEPNIKECESCSG